jgi:hypothetical protein
MIEKKGDNMYIIETKNGYIKEFTMIFDKECRFMKDAYKFKKKDLKKFFIFREKSRYKVYSIDGG